MDTKKISDLQKLVNKEKTPLIAIWGFFDGWHLGHQALLKMLKDKAKEKGYQTLVISFNVKPQSILMDKELSILFSSEDKQQFLIDNQIKNYWELQFTKEMATTKAVDFINWLLSNNIKAVVVSKNIRFGSKGQGDIKLLLDSSLKVFTCEEVVDNSNQKISSTYIKELLEKKDIKQANLVLNNHPYTVTGKVVEGIKEGRQLGFRTANLSLIHNYALPGQAVYLTLTNVDKQWYPSLTIILLRDEKPLVETYLLNFNQDIYGRVVQVRFLEYLRDNLAFTNKEDLIKQIKDDEHRAIKYFSENH